MEEASIQEILPQKAQKDEIAHVKRILERIKHKGND
jgi:hypothetical protein